MRFGFYLRPAPRDDQTGGAPDRLRAPATWSLRDKDPTANRGGTMTLEHWDQNTRKYVLYQITGEHNEDCKRFPFERIPKRVFLDTNVINVLVKHCEHVFDHAPIPVDTVSPPL
jgi:hypothetical protein